MGEERKLLSQFDKDGNKQLDATERAAAREFLKKNPPAGGRGFGPPGGFPRTPGGFGGGENSEPPKPGQHISPADVKPESITDLYAPNVLRTLFLDFENSDWESELTEFHKTDVEVPATLTVDGKKYPGVGVHFRGMSSYMMVRAGQKRSLNVELDFTDKKQSLGGYKTLNLLNSHEDDSFLNTVLYSHIARTYIPAPKANFVRVVINGESWGVYVNAQQFNKEFLRENFHAQKGARWKATGSPMASGGLDYIGEEIAEYKKHYDLKSGDDDDWRALIKLCRTLSQTPPDQLEAALAPMLDIEGALWFIALDNALINGDGYWVRASDYAIYRDPAGKFHILPHDMNEAFSAPHGPGMGGRGPGGRGPGGPGGPGGGPGRPGEPGTQAGSPGAPEGAPRASGGPRPFGGPQIKGVELDPLIGMDDAKKPLRSRLLAVPALQSRYLAHVRTIAQDSLDWTRLGPIVAQYRALIEKELELDTRKLSTFAGFQKATADMPEPAPVADAAPPRRGPESMSLRAFADQRRAYLLNFPAIKSLAP
ncbi:MAG: cotH [Chthoniobacteraceae bacterium]|nr:cotH [Chthoniobacteraceae bacterium]